MPTIRLTGSAIRKAIHEAKDTGSRVELSDVATAGLQLRITRTGAASWSLKMRDATGTSRRYTLGDYPVLGVSGARDQAAATRHRVRHEGADPTAEKRTARQQATTDAASVMTFPALIDLYGEQTGSREKKSWAEACQIASNRDAPERIQRLRPAPGGPAGVNAPPCPRTGDRDFD